MKSSAWQSFFRACIRHVGPVHRNAELLKASFVSERFTDQFKGLLSACNVRLHIQNPAIMRPSYTSFFLRNVGIAGLRKASDFSFPEILRRMDEVKLLTTMPTGYSQFFTDLPGQMESTGSMWCSADGYWYAISLQKAQTCAKLFTTPSYFLQVGF